MQFWFGILLILDLDSHFIVVNLQHTLRSATLTFLQSVTASGQDGRVGIGGRVGWCAVL